MNSEFYDELKDHAFSDMEANPFKIIEYKSPLETDILKSPTLADYVGEDEIVASEELYEYLKTKSKQIPAFKTKLPTLNDLIGGFERGELTVVSGTTGNGKTLLCKTFTANFASNGDNSLWFTYEVPMLQFLRDFGEPIPHFYMPKMLKDKSLDWIYNRILEAKLKYNVGAVFIDHLHFLADLMTSRNPSLEIGAVMRTLKRWALELEMAFFIICHNKKVAQDTELSAGDTRDSSFIEQEADNVFFVWRLLNTDCEAVLKITKNRSRGIMGKKINIIKKGGILVELAPSFVEEEDEDYG